MNNQTELAQQQQTAIEALQSQIDTLTKLISQVIPRDCSSVTGPDGVYRISVDGTSMEVYCETHNNNKWTVIQRRVDGSINFTRTWADYKSGFGDLEGEFWIGNTNLHHLTQNGAVIRIELEDWEGETRYAQYTQFMVNDETNKYRMTVTGYTGDAGNDLSGHSGSQFSTPDMDNDVSSDHCAAVKGGGWWYHNYCGKSLNGVYHHGGPYSSNNGWWDGVVWRTWRGDRYSLKHTTMMIRPQ